MRPAARRALFLAGFVVYFGVLWALWYTPVVFPLKIFVVMLHEFSHGLVTVATGGEIRGIMVTPDQGGLCECAGGNAFLTLSAGYLGSLGWGVLLFWAAVRKGSWARGVLAVIGVATLGLTLLYVRNAFGLAFGLLFGAGLVAAAKYLSVRANGIILVVLGLTSCLYAILDIKSDVLDRPGASSDAHMLAELTGLPTLFWGVVWIAAAVAASAWLLRWAYRRI